VPKPILAIALVLSFLALFSVLTLIDRARMYRGTRQEVADAESRIRQSGAPAAMFACWTDPGGAMTGVVVYSTGLWLKPLLGRAFAIPRAQIVGVALRSVPWMTFVQVKHSSPLVFGPILLHCWGGQGRRFAEMVAGLAVPSQA
jgi:hypothetical protein